MADGTAQADIHLQNPMDLLRPGYARLRSSQGLVG